MDATHQKFREKFIDEANGLLDRLENDILELENKPHDKELIESAFRAMHTIKGVSGMFGFDFIGDFTHHMESIYQAIRDKTLQFSREISDITLQSVDHIRRLLSDEKLADPENRKKHNKLLETITGMYEHSGKVITEIPTPADELVKTVRTWHILLQTSDQMYFRGISLLNIFRDLSTLGKFQITKMDDMSRADLDTWSILFRSEASEDQIKEVFLFIEDDCTIADLTEGDIFYNAKLREESGREDHISLMDMIEEPVKYKAPENITASKEIPDVPVTNMQAKNAKRISVDSSKLDHLMYLVSELITVNSQLNLTARKKQYDQMKTYLEKVDTLAKQFRNNAIEIRLIPLSDMTLRFQRLIRDLSKQLGKKVDFATHGTNTELDKNTIDQLTEPLMHLIRNCIDHGIESPEERIAKGKSETGTITLEAYNSGNHVFINISDDGSGINEEKVRQKAIDKGILKPSDKPGKKEIYDLLFMPGFSTAASLTEVSGRGVGMDVVKKRITDLRGEVMVDSVSGAGTMFTLKLQQSLSIVDSLLFSIENDSFTVPISEIEICTQMKKDEIDKHRHTGTIPFNDRLIPFIDLRSIFNLEGAYPKMVKIIIVKNNDKEIGLLSDKIIGEHQAVLKPLGKSFRNQKYITAASQLGDGRMAFMLDTNAIMNFVSRKEMQFEK